MSTPLPNIIATYFPSHEEISNEQVAAQRDRLRLLIQRGWPDLDTRPNSVFGDAHLNPLAYLFAECEVAGQRWMSDLTPANVAAGVVFNCDFVEQFMQNFGLFPDAVIEGRGVMRLTFNSDSEIEIDRGARFDFNGSTFRLRLENPGNLILLPVGFPLPAYGNYRNFVQSGFGTYVVDLPVVGTLLTAITAGTVGAIEAAHAPTNLTDIRALIPFVPGTEAYDVPGLAKRARVTFHSSSLSDREGARCFILQKYGASVRAGAVVTGDAEMMRDTTNPLGFTDGRVDLHVASPDHNFTDVQRLRLRYYEVQTSGTVQRFIGKLTTASPAVRVTSITYAGNEAVPLNPSGEDIEIFTVTKNPDKAPGLTAAYSRHEELWIAIPMPLNPVTGDPMIVTEIDANGNQYADFLVTYLADPVIRQVAELVEAADNRPAGVDVLVKGYVPIIFDELTIKYRRKTGTDVNKEQARDEIYAAILGAGYPDVLTTAPFIDAVNYAGALGVVAITVRAHVQWSVARFLLPVGTELPDTDYAEARAAAIEIQSLEIINDTNLTPEYRDPALGTEDETYRAVGSRSVRYLIDRDLIRLSEVKN